VLYYPPNFRVNPEPAAFRIQVYDKPSSAALNTEASAPGSPESAALNAHMLPSDLLQQGNSNAAQAATQALVDKYRATAEARKPVTNLPIRVAFPAVGPSLFLVSELTAENQAANVQLTYQREKKDGVK